MREKRNAEKGYVFSGVDADRKKGVKIAKN